MWNLKYGANEPIYKSETDSRQNRLVITKWEGRGNGMDWEFEVVDVNYYI